MGRRAWSDVVQFARAEALDVTGLSKKEGSYERVCRLDRPPGRVEFGAQDGHA